MNLTDAESVRINGKEVSAILINDNIVYRLLHMELSADKGHIRTGEEAIIGFECEELPNTNIELFKVINMTRTLVDTLETDENGQATYEYTGTGAGSVGFVAVYDEWESNTVVIDDYVPVATDMSLSASASLVKYGENVSLTVTVKDQHDEDIESGTVTFKANGVSIGTGSISEGVATLTTSALNSGVQNIVAEVGSAVSNTVVVEVYVPATSSILLEGRASLYEYEIGQYFATCKDQQGQGIGSGVSVTFYDGETSLGTATTDASSIASFEFSLSTLGTHTITAKVGAVTSNALSVEVIELDFKVSTPTLVDGSQILSYADEQQTPNSQYATLRVSLLNSKGIWIHTEGIPIQFYKYVDGVNDVYLDTIYTDNVGQSSYTYHSLGIGDVPIYAKVGSFVSETYTIEDCIKYYGSTYSSATTVNLDLPTEYKIKFTLFSNSSTQSSGGRANACFLRFDSSTGGYVGKGGTSSRNIGIGATYLPNDIPVSVDTEYTFSKENGVVYLSDGTDTINVTSSAFTKLYAMSGTTDGQVKNVKVKPL